MAPQDAPVRKSAAAFDILILIVGSAALFLAEQWARKAGLVPLGEDSSGVFAVVGGMAIAVGLVFFRGQTLRDIGFRRPTRLWTVPLWAIGIVATWLVAQTALPMIAALFIELPAPDLSQYNVYQNLPAAIGLVLILVVTASVPEEIIYRGFLMDRFSQIFGRGRLGTFITILSQGLIFGSIHIFNWGPGGMIITTIMGMVWGTAFVLCKRNLWIVISAHTLGHILLGTQLYFVDAGAAG